MSLGDSESPAYNYAEEVVFTPLIEWAVKLWAFWSEPGAPNPGTLAAALAEPNLMLDVRHTLMRQELHRMAKKTQLKRKRKRAASVEESSSEDSSGSDAGSDCEPPPKKKKQGKAAGKQAAGNPGGGNRGGGKNKKKRGGGNRGGGNRGNGKQGKRSRSDWIVLRGSTQPWTILLYCTTTCMHVNISDLGVRDLFRSNLTSPLLVRGPHYTHVYLLHAVYSQTLFTC